MRRGRGRNGEVSGHHNPEFTLVRTLPEDGAVEDLLRSALRQLAVAAR